MGQQSSEGNKVYMNQLYLSNLDIQKEMFLLPLNVFVSRS